MVIKNLSLITGSVEEIKPGYNFETKILQFFRLSNNFMQCALDKVSSAWYVALQKKKFKIMFLKLFLKRIIFEVINMLGLKYYRGTLDKVSYRLGM